MEKQGSLMRGCWRKRWKALNTCTTIENTKKYYGKPRFIDAEMLAGMLESIENLLKPLQIQRNMVGKQGVLMRGYWQKCWQALKIFETYENTKKSYGKILFINAGMLAEMLESIENLLDH